MLLEGKVAVVTGASRGIGRGCAVALAEQGAQVMLNYHAEADQRSRRAGAAEETLDEVRRAGGRAEALEGDVAEPRTAQELVARTIERFGRIDVLVNNAGICPFHDFLDMPPELFERVVRVNLVGTFLCSQAAAQAMVRQGQGGSIIAMSSISALVGGAQQVHYTPTKAGVHSLMQSMAVALGPHGIRCNSVMPGAIATDINRDDWSDPEKRARLAARVPLGRFGEPADVAGAVVFLASDLARYVTGASVLVDGGMFVNLQ